MGMAIINTSEITNESFLGSPLMAPLVAMAAETPQIETAPQSKMAILFVYFKCLAGNPEAEIPDRHDHNCQISQCTGYS